MDTLEDDVMISVLLSTISLKNYLTKSEITIIVFSLQQLYITLW